MRDQALGLLLLAACARVDLPHDFAAIRRGDPHPIRVAVEPFEDARDPEDRADGAERFTYNGVDYAHTDLRALRGGPSAGLTSVIARHLAAARVFAQLILVDSAADAPEAELVLRGKIRRARGYVEAEARKEDGGKPVDERSVLAEVFLEDLRLCRGEVCMIRSDAGWSIAEERRLDTAPTPWGVLDEALFVAIEQLVELFRAADLSGAVVVPEAARLLAKTSSVGAFGALERDAPEGWRFERGEDEAPLGWRGAAKCAAGRVVQRQTLRFHRALGPHTPTVRLWSCPASARLDFDARAERPAIYAGTRGARHVFLHQAGPTNWARAPEELARYLGVEPAGRHVFRVGGE